MSDTAYTRMKLPLVRHTKPCDPRLAHVEQQNSIELKINCICFVLKVCRWVLFFSVETMKRNVERKKKYEKKMEKTGNKKCCSETTRPRDFVEFEMKNAHGKDGDGASEVSI